MINRIIYYKLISDSVKDELETFSTGENQYTIWYNLNYYELCWLFKHLDVDDYDKLITLE